MTARIDPYFSTPIARPEWGSADPDGPYWEGLLEGKLLLQRCKSCATWQWGPEIICHACRSFDLAYMEVAAVGRIYSYQRVWHAVPPVNPDQVPYIIVLVELSDPDGLRVVGNLVGDPLQAVEIGQPVEAVFEHHDDHAEGPYVLIQWKFKGAKTDV